MSSPRLSLNCCNPGADGIDIAPGVARAHILNQGSVAGAAAAPNDVSGSGYTGGIGIDFSSPGRLDNQGIVIGGAGGYGGYLGGIAGSGGTGIHLAQDVTLVNSGIVLGGVGSFAYTEVGSGGAGVIADGYDRLSNSGTIQGGDGGESDAVYPYVTSQLPSGLGGIGVSLGDASRLTNTGLIEPPGPHGRAGRPLFGRIVGQRALQPP